MAERRGFEPINKMISARPRNKCPKWTFKTLSKVFNYQVMVESLASGEVSECPMVQG